MEPEPIRNSLPATTASVSVVVPAYRSEASLRPLVERLLAVLQERPAKCLQIFRQSGSEPEWSSRDSPIVAGEEAFRRHSITDETRALPGRGFSQSGWRGHGLRSKSSPPGLFRTEPARCQSLPIYSWSALPNPLARARRSCPC